jgi:hypothetical protein
MIFAVDEVVDMHNIAAHILMVNIRFILLLLKRQKVNNLPTLYYNRRRIAQKNLGYGPPSFTEMPILKDNPRGVSSPMRGHYRPVRARQPSCPPWLKALSKP